MIEINNLTTVSVNTEFLRKIAKEVLGGEKIKGEVELSIALVGTARMREINKRYLGKNRATDVLSFPESKTSPFKRIQSLGEIIVCPQEVKKNAKRFGSNFEKELTRVLIHGILSLLGYDYERGKQEVEKMTKKEEYYLSQI